MFVDCAKGLPPRAKVQFLDDATSDSDQSTSSNTTGSRVSVPGHSSDAENVFEGELSELSDSDVDDTTTQVCPSVYFSHTSFSSPADTGIIFDSRRRWFSIQVPNDSHQCSESELPDC